MKKYTAWLSRSLLTAAFLTASGGCSRPASEQSTLNLALKASPNKLDPALVVDVAEGEICTQLFQGLVKFSPSGEIGPCLAKSWAIHDGGRRYVFSLDNRMRFSNGRAVTAKDVLYSFERVLNPDSPSPRRWALARILGAGEFTSGARDHMSGLEAPDDTTVVIELGEPFIPFLSMLALPAAMVVPEEALTPTAFGEDIDGKNGFRAFSGLPVGSGPWRIESWERGDFLSLVPNPYHPRQTRGINRIRYRIIPEAFTRVAEFEVGALDVLEIPPAELKRFLSDPRLSGRLQSRSELRVYYVGLNNTRKPFSDVRVRRALNMAVDVGKIIEALADGQGIRACGSIPPGLEGFVRREPYPHDVETARRLLAEAGYPEGFSMEIWQRNSPEGARLLEAVQGYLKRVGVEVKLQRREWSAFKEAVSTGRVDAFFLDWFADYPDAENFIAPLFYSRNAGGGGNRTFFKDPQVDRLIERASRTAEKAESSDLYGRIDSLIYEQAPWIYLYFPTTHHAVASGLEGYVMPSLYLGIDYTVVFKRN